MIAVDLSPKLLQIKQLRYAFGANGKGKADGFCAKLAKVGFSPKPYVLAPLQVANGLEERNLMV
jgi:hypothetical protein